MSVQNNVTLIGNLGGDPELRRLENGSMVANFSIASTRTYRKDDVKHQETYWGRCVVWGKRAEVIEQYVKKGHRLAVQGELRTKKYTNKEGREISETIINVTDFQMLTQKGDSVQVAGQTFPQQNTSTASPGTTTPQPDDDLPF